MSQPIDHHALNIRPVRESELATMLELLSHLHARDEPLPDEPALQEVWQQILTNPKIHCLVGELDGQLVCTCIMTIIPNLTRGARPYSLVENVVTHADFRNRGLGAQLMQHTLQLAWDSGCYKVMLLSGLHREEAHRFYERVGFEKRRVGFVAQAPVAQAPT